MQNLSLARFAVLAFVGVSVFFTQLGGARLWDRDEPRNSRASHEMLERGDWIVPTFNGELRDHKPILLYWGQMASYLAIGESEFSARLPSALCALLAVMATAILATRLSGMPRGINREGFWAAAALATCLLFVMAGRAATPDASLVAFSTVGIALLVISAIKPMPPYSTGRVGAARWIGSLSGYAALGVAVLAKGPVGFVLPVAVVHLWWLVCRRMSERAPESEQATKRSLFDYAKQAVQECWHTFNPLQCLRAMWALRVLPGVLVVLLVAVPWYAAVGVATDGAFLRGFFWEHNVERAMSSMEGHNGGVFFYPLAFIVGTFPWSLWLIPIALWARGASKESVVYRQMVILGVAWIYVYVMAFSMAGTKLPSYITPCYAGAALVIGGYLKQFETAWAMPSWRWRYAAYGLTCLVGIGIAGGLYFLSWKEAMPIVSQAAWGGVVIAVLGVVALGLDRWSRTQWVPAAWLAAAAAFQIILFGVGSKSVDHYRSDLRLIAEADELSPSENWLSIGGMEPSWVHYLGHKIVEVTDAPESEEAWEQVGAFLEQFPDGQVIVVGDRTLGSLESRKPFLPALEQVALANRFLKPGQMAVFQRARTSNGGYPPDMNTLQPASGRMAQAVPLPKSERTSGVAAPNAPPVAPPAIPSLANPGPPMPALPLPALPNPSMPIQNMRLQEGEAQANEADLPPSKSGVLNPLRAPGSELQKDPEGLRATGAGGR